jgi:hypothetical protein
MVKNRIYSVTIEIDEKNPQYRTELSWEYTEK